MIRVQEIHRFPVKGLGPESLAEAHVRAGAGIDGDRAVALSNGTRPAADGWDGPGAFTALKNEISGAAFATATGATGDITVTAPDGEAVTFDPAQADSRDSAAASFRRWFPAQGEHRRRLVRAPGGMFDSKKSGLSIINLATVRALSRAAGRHVDPHRFRANLYIDGLPPFAEFGLVGRRLRIGEVSGVVSKPIQRCSATTVDPRTAISDLPVPTLLARDFGHLHCGVYLQVHDGGLLTRGARLDIVGPAAPEDDVPDSPAPRVMRLVGAQNLTADITEVVLEDPRGTTARLYRPGQHLRVHLDTDAGPLWRTYTITDVEDTYVRLAVRRRGEGSQLLASREPGSQVLASGPLGGTTLDDVQAGARLALVSAGIGITPTLGFLAGLLRTRDLPAEVRVMHVEPMATPLAARAIDLAGTLRERGVSVTVTHAETARTGRPSAGDLSVGLDGIDEVFVCGPAAFMTMVAEAAPRARTHRETFSSPAPRGADEPPALPPATVSFGPHRIAWRPADGTLLETLEVQGIAIPSSCRGGACGTCRLTLASGAVDYAVEPLAATGPGEVLTCSAYPRGDVRLVAPDVT